MLLLVAFGGVQQSIYVGPRAPEQQLYFKLHVHMPKAYPEVVQEGGFSDFGLSHFFLFFIVSKSP